MTDEIVIQHIWTLSVVRVGDDDSRDYRYVAPAEFEKAFAAGKELLAKKHPNTLKENWPNHAWHPDLEIVAIERGMELTSEEESAW